MTDKDIIKKEIEKLIERAKAEMVLHPKTILAAKNYLLIEDYNKLISFINSLTEEPVNIDFEQELYKAFGQVKDFTLGIDIAKYFYRKGAVKEEPVSNIWHDAYKEQPEECETIVAWNPVTRSGEVIHNVMSVERGYLWAYIDDLLHKKEEPVSEDLEKQAHKELEEVLEVTCDTQCAQIAYEEFIVGAKWQKKQTIEKACEWIENNVDKYLYIHKEFNEPCIHEYQFLYDLQKAMEENL